MNLSKQTRESHGQISCPYTGTRGKKRNQRGVGNIRSFLRDYFLEKSELQRKCSGLTRVAFSQLFSLRSGWHINNKADITRNIAIVSIGPKIWTPAGFRHFNTGSQMLFEVFSLLLLLLLLLLLS